MRNFNTPLAIVLSTAALAGGAPAAQAETADQPPISTPQEFTRCAQAATTFNPDITPTVDEVGGVGILGHQDAERAKASIDVQQVSNIVTGNTVCTGEAKTYMELVLRVGARTLSIPGMEVKITYNSELIDNPHGVRDSAVGGFSYARACNIAQRNKESVRLARKVTKIYGEPGYPTVLRGRTSRVEKLPCD